jgi:succinate dehydrogenase / fumarate reductase cytochrome b subunit
MTHKRPININLFKIKLPLSAMLSISHRISGILIFFVVLPVTAIVLSFLYDSQDSYNNIVNFYLSNWIIKLFLISLVLIFQYHIFTGVRHMMMDFHLLEESLSSSFRSAVITLFLFLLNAVATVWIML